MGWLLDVNALIALLDSEHHYHPAMHRWFVTRTPAVFGVSPVVENGAVRVLSQPTYKPGRQTPRDVLAVLEMLKNTNASTYDLIPDDISISDSRIFRFEYVTGPNQITDAYLLGLAHVRGWRLVSFDRSLPWQAVRGATADLVFNPFDVNLSA